ncbi:hypothetical protein DL95DRAFT_464269 [Leptodontidium sp. 2 PMI_412]|nr:hypothetical protein DL95DRAFT_464269 [Leptodontidium sp. 2 PMI_412]
MDVPDSSNKRDDVERKGSYDRSADEPRHPTMSFRKREAQASSSRETSGGEISPLAQANGNAASSTDEGISKVPHDRLSDLLLETTSTWAAEQPTTAHNMFIKNPQSYFWDVRRLQQQIFDLGCDGLGINVMPYDQFALPLVEFPSSSGSDTVDMHKMLAKCHVFVFGQAIKSALALAESTGFLPGTYSILVEDHRRYRVLQLVPVSLTGLETILDLLDEAMSRCISGYGWLTRVLDDILEATTCIMESLGIPIPAARPSSESLAEKCKRICRVVYSMLSVFIELHDYMTEELLIETSGPTIKMSRKRFRCLDQFVKKPVFVFSTLVSVPTTDQRYYLSAFLEDLANL